MVYTRFTLTSLDFLPPNGHPGDIAMFRDEQGFKCYVFERNGWVLEPGNRPTSNHRRKLTHHPFQPALLLTGHEFDTVWMEKSKAYTQPTAQAPDLAPSTSKTVSLPAVSPLNLTTPLESLPLGNPNNRLFLDILAHLQLLFPDPSLQFNSCSTPLTTLASLTLPVTIGDVFDAASTGVYPGGNQLTLQSVMQDLMHSPPIPIFEAFSSEPDNVPWTTADLMTCIFRSSFGARDPGWVDEYQVLGTLAVPASEQGSSAVRIALPDHLKDWGDSSDFGYRHNNTSVVTGAGYLTEPHFDYAGSSQLIVHVEGRKLWMTWPPTKGNVETFMEYFRSSFRSQRLTLSTALQKLEGLEVRYLTKSGQCFFLLPYEFHACISETCSVHRGHNFVHYDHFEHFRQAHLQVLDSFAQVADNTTLGDCNRCLKHLEDGRTDLEHYWSLLSNKPGWELAHSMPFHLRELEQNTERLIERLISKTGTLAPPIPPAPASTRPRMTRKAPTNTRLHTERKAKNRKVV